LTGDFSVDDIYQRLLDYHGKQRWWPAETPFEVMVGAVLTQNTNWKNVETAISKLQHADALDPQHILDLPDVELGELLRSSGYFNVKARRLKALCVWLVAAGGVEALASYETLALRASLLSVNGVGPETADDILLYALDRPVFVIDAYTRRIFSRIGLIVGDEPYETLRSLFESILPGGVDQFNEYHALIVRHAAGICRTRPDCNSCCLSDGCQKTGLISLAE
jgi:endonuclease-3 related protein